MIGYLFIFIALAATAYGRYVATSNAALLADAERSHNLPENLILALVSFLWNMIPAVLWTVGMLIARQHPLDRTSVGTGLATLLPHVYQTLLAEMQLVSASLSVLCVAVAIVVAVRREPATQA
jgi:hypothetical protein